MAGLALLIAASITIGFHIIFPAAFGCYIAWLLFQQYERGREILQFAQRMEFSYLGGSLPPTFPLHLTSSSRAHSIDNTVIGNRGKKVLVLFDCRMGHGKTSYWRGVLAVRGQHQGFGVAQYGPDLSTEQVDDWTVVYGSKRLLSLGEIEELVAEM